MSIAVRPAVRPTEDASGRSSYLLSAALFYLGLGLAMHLADPVVWRWTLTLIVAGALSLVGWRRIEWTSTMKRYVGWALGLSAWVAISSVAAWAPVPLYRGRMFVLWLLVIVPGLASLLRDKVRRIAFASGLVAGASVFSAVAAYRLVRGVSVFDLGPTYPDKFGSYNERFWHARAYMLGQSRNTAAVVVVMVLPLLLSPLLPRRVRALRWPLVVLSVTWIMFSGSRIAVLGSILVVLTAVLMQSGGARRVRVLYVALLAVTVITLGIQEIGGQATVAVDRLAKGSDEGPSTDIRTLGVRKSWHVALEHPLFGIGFGGIAGYYHPVVDEGANRNVRQQVLQGVSQNGYTGLMAEAGFPAFALFLLLIAGLIRGAVSQRDSPEVRGATCAFAAALVILLGRDISPLTFAPMVLLLGTVAAAESTIRERRPVRAL
jgi:hypothetical protein